MAAPYMRRLLPRHMKGYLWICFLTLGFCSMLLSDSGYSLYSMICTRLFADDIRAFVFAPPFKVVNLHVGAPKPMKPLPYASSAPEPLAKDTAVRIEEQAPL